MSASDQSTQPDQDTHDRIRLSRIVPAPIDTVWAAFTTLPDIESWWWSTLDATHELDPRPGGRYRFAVPSAGFAVRGTVLELDDRRHVAWSWIWEDGDSDGPLERVDIGFTTVGEGTQVDIEHQGPWTHPETGPNYTIGWMSTLDVLVRLHAGESTT